MNKDIKPLYDFYRENALLISKLKNAELLFRNQLNHKAGNLVSDISNDLSRVGTYPQYIDLSSYKNGIYRIVTSLQYEDFVLCADYLQEFIYDVMIPLQSAIFESLQEYITELYNSQLQESNGMISLEETPCGYPALLYHSSPSLYLCSTSDPMEEAYILARKILAPEADEYHIWGMGLGYHVYALYQVTNGSADIYVYDNDPILFDIARSEKIGPWQGVFNNNRIHLIPDENYVRFSESLSKPGNKIFIHTPSFQKLPENDSAQIEKKKILKKIQITINSYSDNKDDIGINFYRNIKHTDGFAEDLFSDYKDQIVIVIAAGPSLDKNISVLKEALDNNVPIKVICVGTVLKKLLKAEITPDAFFEMDPGKGTYAQIEGMEHLTIPMILDTSAYYEFAQNYKGRKYLACQKHFELSEKMGHTLFNTGGSVTTLALDFAIQARARKIVMIGCDMAFTGNKSHAAGTALNHSTQNERVISLKGYYGDTVNTSFALSMYKKWIEDRIRNEDAKDIEFINSTEGGAYIEGMKHLPLSAVLGVRPH